MQICIFGGTGPTGVLLVEQTLAEGHEVVVYARTPAKLPDHERLSLIVGQLGDAEAIAAAITGTDAVLSLLGPSTKRSDSPPLLEGYRSIIAAMREKGPRRLVAIGTPSMTDVADRRDWKIDPLVFMMRTFQPTAYKTIVSTGQMVRESELDWTIVRVPFLSNGARTDNLNVRNVGQPGRLQLSRANAAAFILQQAMDTTYIRKAPLVSDA